MSLLTSHDIDICPIVVNNLVYPIHAKHIVSVTLRRYFRMLRSTGGTARLVDDAHVSAVLV